jgi:uncharacterized repeat protein (TIGR02543 family)
VGKTVEIVTDYLLSPGEHVRIKIVTVEGTSMQITDTGSRNFGGNNPTDRYTLTVNIIGTGTVAKSPNQADYLSGDNVQLIPAVPMGWQFDHWENDLTGNAEPGSILMDSDKIVTAVFTPKGYALDIKIQGEGTVAKDLDQLTYHIGDPVALTATPTLGWKFVGWTGDITSSINPETITIDANPQVTATFVEIPTLYSLTVTSNPSVGGSVTIDKQGPYLSGTDVTLTAIPAAGYTFTGWSGDLTGSLNPSPITITKNMIVTAQFTPNTATLTLAPNPPYAGSITANPIGPYHVGDVVQLTAVPNTAFSFSTWSQDLGGSTNPISITLTGNKAVTANFVPREYALDIQILGEGTVAKSPNKVTYHLGDAVQLTATPTEHWSFAGYTGDTTNSNLQATVNIDENPTVLASFTQTQYSLTVTSNPSAGGPVELSNPGPTYVYNDKVTLIPKPVTGYSFIGWEGDLTGTTVPSTLTITGNMIVTANYEANPVTLTLNVSPAGTGTINADPTGPYRFEKTVGLTAVPFSGYTFSSWSGGLTGSTNPSAITLLGDTTVTANFVQREIPLTINIQGTGTVTKSPNQATYHLSDVVTLTPNPASGWTFAGWSQDLSGTNNPASITIDENPQVTATFTQTPFTLTVNVNPPTGGSVSTNIPEPYNLGNTVTLTASPKPGFTFTGWSGQLSGSSNPAQIIITGNMVVTANFVPNSVTLSLNVNPAGTGAITPNNVGPYHYGDVVQLTAVPVTGYSFSSWSGDTTGTTNPTTITLNGDKTVTATFTQNPTQILSDVNFDGTIWDRGWNDWGNPPWGPATDQSYSGSTSAKCIGGNHGTYQPGAFTSDPMNTQGATSITISFYYRTSTTLSSNNLQIYASGNPGSTYSASHFTTLDRLGTATFPATPNNWNHYTITIANNPTNAHYFTSTFRFGFISSLPDGAAIWVDNVVITKNII